MARGPKAFPARGACGGDGLAADGIGSGERFNAEENGATWRVKGDEVGRPIRNPVTQEEHRVRIDLPDGFEYKQAEIGNTVRARVSATEPLSFTLGNTYAQLNPLDWTNA